MRKYLSLLCLLLATYGGTAQNKWTFLKGDAAHGFGVYGTQGVADEKNNPGVRRYSQMWAWNGKLYLYGGWGANTHWDNSRLSDLWEYDTTVHQWKWLKGETYNSFGDTRVTGTQGVHNAANTPGAKYNATTWVLNDKLYMFGGGDANYTEKAELWALDMNTKEWAWLKGSVTNSIAAGVYGTQGVAAATNVPGARQGSASWVANGKLHLYGGYGRDASGSVGNLGDLWVYDPATNNWTWLKGSNLSGVAANYGTQGVAVSTNNPGGRQGAGCWSLNGKFYLYGGNNDRDDLWEYDIASNVWTWIKGSTTLYQQPVYGTLGVAGSANTPGARFDMVCWTNNGKLYMHGANGTDDVWAFDPATNNWTWVRGQKVGQNNSADYGMQRVASGINSPGKRQIKPASCFMGTKLYIFGGNVGNHFIPDLNDLWEYNNTTNVWTWLKGHHDPMSRGVIGVPGLAGHLNIPAGRTNAVVAQNGSTVYLFGGDRFQTAAAAANKDELWKYDILRNEWTFLKGHLSDTPVRGTKGVSAAGNTPGQREKGCGWVHNNKFYTFGGSLQFSPGGLYNDLWEYDPTNSMWTLLKGSDTAYSRGHYGTKGVPGTLNIPSSRINATSWQQGNKFYVFGGEGIDSVGDNIELNDLWEYDPATNRWTWLHGSRKGQSSGVYGTKGSYSLNNTPGARYGAVPFYYNNTLYLFGGYGKTPGSLNTGYINDIWQYDPAANQWRWLKGDNSTGSLPVWGTKGVYASANNPTASGWNAGWTLNSSFYMRGGNGSDMWQYDFAINNWRWIGGNAYTYNTTEPGLYIKAGVADDANIPGSRKGMSWVYGNRLYLFGGYGSTANSLGFTNNHNDIWSYQACNSASQCYAQGPVGMLDSIAYLCTGKLLILNAGNPGGSKYLWSTGDTSQYLTVNTAGTYWVKVTDPVGSFVNDTTIVVSNMLQVNLGYDTSVCSGQLVLNAGNPSAKYMWNTGASVQSIPALHSGQYYVHVFKSNSCVAIDSILLDVKPLPAVNLGPDKKVCAGDSISLLSSPMANIASYKWSNADTASSIVVKNAGIYWLEATSTDGCLNTDTTSVSLLALPMPNTGNDTAICASDIIGLDAGSGYRSYLWTTLDTVQIISAATGTYIVAVTDSNSCIGKDTIIIIPKVPAASGILATPLLPGQFQFDLLNPVYIGNVSWNFGDGSISNSPNPVHQYLSDGSYMVTATLFNECDSAQVSLTVNATRTGITQHWKHDVISVSPNPTQGTFTIRGSSLRGDKILLTLVNSIGEIVYKADIQLPPGN